MILLILLAQASSPDIELDVRLTARRVEIRQSGGETLTVRARPDAGSNVEVQAPRREGRRTLENVNVRVRAQARIASPSANSPPPETPRR